MGANTLAKDLSNHMSRTLAEIFTNRTSFSQESWGESNKIMKSQKISWPWGLGPKNYVCFGVHLGPGNISSHMSRTIATIFINRTSFSQESWHESNRIMKPQKTNDLGVRGLDRNYICATWAPKTYQAIRPEP